MSETAPAFASKLLIVRKGEEETEYTVQADAWEVQGGNILAVWRKGYGLDRYEQQWFSLVNVSRWAWINA
jgi:hypothetical protein